MTRTGRILYSVAHTLFRTLAKLLLRLRIIGADRIPKTGGVLIAANHTSYTDIPLIGCSIERPAGFMGKVELFSVPILGWFYRRMGGFPITRFHSKEKLGEAIRRLTQGEVVVMYPEGQRTQDGKLKPAMPGIGMLVTTTGVTVVPAYISGTNKVLPVGAKWIRLYPVTIIFGQPIDFKYIIRNSEPSRETYQSIGDAVMKKILELSHEIGDQKT